MANLGQFGPSIFRVPAEDAEWSEIAMWAYTLGEAHGLIGPRLKPLAEAAIARFRIDGTVPESPEQLAKCLYYEQRRFHWLDVPPDAEHLEYIRALVRGLRDAGQRLRDAAALVAQMEKYAATRRAFLAALGTSTSNRDPLGEFSERLVAAVYGGSVALDRTQKGWDVLAPSDDGIERVQVKYLANPAGSWINGHAVTAIPDIERYDLVLFEDLRPLAVLSFRLGSLARVAAELKKRHPHTESVLQLTQRDVLCLLEEPARFAQSGVRVIRLTTPAASEPSPDISTA